MFKFGALKVLIYQHNETKLLNRSIVLAHTDSRVSLGLWRTRYTPFGLKLIIIELVKKVEKRLERIVSKHSLRWLSFSTPDCTTSVWHLDKICYMIRFLGISIRGGIIINIDFFSSGARLLFDKSFWTSYEHFERSCILIRSL